MNSQFSQQPKLEQDHQPLPYSLPPLQNPDRVQYYPIFYIKQNNQPIHSNFQQLPIDQQNGWFVCHPVMQNDPFFPHISNFSQFIHKPPAFNPEIPIKIEDDAEIPQTQQSQQFQEPNSNKKNDKSRNKKQKDQNKLKRNVENSKELEIQPCIVLLNLFKSQLFSKYNFYYYYLNYNCLKRYCACFHSGRMCLDECQCKDCKNCTEFADERDEAINHVYKKCHRDKKVPVNELLSLQMSYGCKCKSTGCQKKYCECFKRGQICGEQCACEDCLNIPFGLSQKDLKRKKTLLK